MLRACRGLVEVFSPTCDSSCCGQSLGIETWIQERLNEIRRCGEPVEGQYDAREPWGFSGKGIISERHAIAISLHMWLRYGEVQLVPQWRTSRKRVEDQVQHVGLRPVAAAVDTITIYPCCSAPRYCSLSCYLPEAFEWLILRAGITKDLERSSESNP